MTDPTAQVFEIIRGATHDGPGLRTTVFLKGCPLRCRWCQNPEGIETTPDVWWEARTCIGCRECCAACPARALTFVEGGGLHRNRLQCARCGVCADQCPARAITRISRAWTLDALLREVLKDRDYYAAFGGGVTVSGGEPLLQAEFVAAFFKRLRAAGVPTALDTCGAASTAVLKAILPLSDHVLFDVKIMDSELHKTFTGQSNARILTNLIELAATLRAARKTETATGGARTELWLRTPLVPAVTATPENIRAIGRFIRQHLLEIITRWELCAFNAACVGKYDKLGLSWTYAGTAIMPAAAVEALRQCALSTGFPAARLVVSGLTSPS